MTLAIQVLLPAVFLHGAFDFALFLMGYLQFAYNIQSVAFVAFSFITPIAITIAGLVWACRAFKKVSCGRCCKLVDIVAAQ